MALLSFLLGVGFSCSFFVHYRVFFQFHEIQIVSFRFSWKWSRDASPFLLLKVAGVAPEQFLEFCTS